uniref:Translation initiation factor 5A C-terminal domain-containing protein n=1 Tax=Chenopodium quinoa TaxID=63459 RepID=A0A803LY93_CHEQI
MGNCIEHESSQVIWGGEDWTSLLMSNGEKRAVKMEEEELLRKIRAKYSVSKEVKVKMTKKQFEEWLKKIDVEQEGLCVEQTLGELMKVGVQCKVHKISWKPRLKVIPEAKLN